MKQLIKPHQMQDIYLTKEQHRQGKVASLVKDPKAWDMMCECGRPRSLEHLRAETVEPQ
jgi:hypothetical protein